MAHSSSTRSRRSAEAAAAAGVPVHRGQVLLRVYLATVAVLAPLKFGSVIGSTEIPLLPASLLEWLVASWPPFLLGGLAGIGLLWALVVCPGSLTRHPAWRLLWVWLALLAGCGPGLICTGEWDYALTFGLYLCGVCAFLAAVLLASAADTEVRPWLLRAVAAGTLLCGLAGWHQRLWGFEAMRQYMEAQVRETGRTWDGALQGKVLQTRVHQPFFHPNSYAAHLVLTGPLALLLLWRAGRRVHPPVLSQWLFVGVGGVLVGGALVMSQSRGAQLALGGGFGMALLGYRRLQRWRWLLLALALAVGAGAMLLVNAGRDLMSASARLDYYRGAVRIAMERPATGAGLGEFLSAYVRVKPLAAEETRAAHNLVLEMLSQAGVVGGLAALPCVLLPAWLALRRRQPGGDGDELLAGAAVAGLGAWVLHALLDFNLQIPPTVATAAVLPVLCWSRGEAAGAPTRSMGRAERWLLVLLGISATAALWRVPGERAFRRLGDRVERGSAEALEAPVRQATAGLPLSPEPWIMVGRDRLGQGQAAAASRAFQEAIRRAPNRSSLYAWLAQAALQSGDLAVAEAAAREAWQRYPGSARAALLRGLVALVQIDGGASLPGGAGVWVVTGLSCHPGLAADRDGVTVTLGVPLGRPAPPCPVADLCRRLTELRLALPDDRALPVRFRPLPEGG